MNTSKQDGAQVSFTVIETIRVHAQAIVSQSDFEQETGIAWANATEQDIAEYLTLASLSYEEISVKERLDDPIFIDLSVHNHGNG